MSTVMNKIKLAIAIIVGTPIGIIGLVFILFRLNIPTPVGGNELYNKQFLFGKNRIIGDMIAGRGYVFPQDQRDIWMRIRTTANFENDKPLPGSLSTCTPESFKIIQSWFLAQAADSQKLFGFIPTSGDSKIDREILTDTNNLRCGDSGPGSIQGKNKFGEPPHDCSTGWVLYHKPSGFYYRRFACHN